ncbi:unnamed protein product [Phytophthora lilii]|uniref:RxLR effector protein n=1 Tax=Phytophthora lilii TaxID=2077276 RepID=A0A9W6TW58_9STRA|nr:unnamed protein product [Phytophthora lilii]
MRLHRIVLLAATILLTNVYAVSLPELKVSHPSIRASGTSLTSDTTPKRLLRTQTATGRGVKERGALETLKILLKSRQMLQLEGYLKNGEPASQASKKLKLDDIVEK